MYFITARQRDLLILSDPARAEFVFRGQPKSSTRKKEVNVTQLPPFYIYIYSRSAQSIVQQTVICGYIKLAKATGTAEPMMLFLLDTEKEFDFLELLYLMAVLEKILFLGWARLLYREPVAQVKRQRTLQEWGPTWNRTRLWLPATQHSGTQRYTPLPQGEIKERQKHGGQRQPRTRIRLRLFAAQHSSAAPTPTDNSRSGKRGAGSLPHHSAHSALKRQPAGTEPSRNQATRGNARRLRQQTLGRRGKQGVWHYCYCNRKQKGVRSPKEDHNSGEEKRGRQGGRLGERDLVTDLPPPTTLASLY
ncbi:hypothetical protein NDU88_001738 [Pleurodeles waltl]|uniref:Uncharacterized protein n=1 Tax=Pleurodeles waltl TaxID=8319 RepID=A0AAV7R9E9_PLEWA|nr:hypothetical protein NDU88_001738 [Pleurodeles waltl]